MFLKIGLIAIAVLMVAVAGLGFLLKTSYEANGILKANVVQAEAAVAQQRQALVYYRETVEEQTALIGDLSEDATAVAIERDEAIAQLNEYRAKIARAATGRPSLVGRLATRATNRVMQQFHTASGGDGDEANGDLSPTGTGTDPAPAD